MSIPKKSMVGGDSGRMPAAPHKPVNSSSLRVPVVKTGGPGQSWINLTKEDVEEYKRTHPQPETSDKSRKSLLGWLGSVFKRSAR